MFLLFKYADRFRTGCSRDTLFFVIRQVFSMSGSVWDGIKQQDVSQLGNQEEQEGWVLRMKSVFLGGWFYLINWLLKVKSCRVL